MIDPLEFGQAPAPAGNGAAASAVKDPPSLEGLLYAAGMVSADQLGELVRDAVLTQRPVAEIALERGFATVDVMEKLLGQVGLSLADVLGEAEPAPQAAVPGPEAAVAPPLADVLRVTLPGPPAPGPAQAPLLDRQLMLRARHRNRQLRGAPLPARQQPAEPLYAKGRRRGLLFGRRQLRLGRLKVLGQGARFVARPFKLGLQGANAGGARRRRRQQHAGQDHCPQGQQPPLACLCRDRSRHEARETSGVC